jgi:hypothetical protein
MVAKIDIVEIQLPKETHRAALGVRQVFWNAEGPMKKFIFAISLLMLGFTVSAHADDGSGPCCVYPDSVSQAGRLGQPPYACCIPDIDEEDCVYIFDGDPVGSCSSCCPNLTVSAGDNQTICAGDTVLLHGKVEPPVYDSVKWTTSGNGTFDDNATLNPTYTPGSSDISAGSVKLTLTAFSSVPDCQIAALVGGGGVSPCPPKSSSLKVTINPLPDCTITLDPDAADGSVYAGTEHTASVPSAGTNATYDWVIQDENGNNLITSPAPYGNSVKWMAPQHPGKVYVNVKVTNANGCSCTYDPPIGGKDKGIPVLVQINVRALSGWGTAIFTLLLTGLAVAVFRRRSAA